MNHAPILAIPTASNARVAAPVVTIQALRIDGRRLSRSVFRQLPECDLIDPGTMEPAGLIWGWVNGVADCPVGRVYVVQRGDELCRAEFLPFTAGELRERRTATHHYPSALWKIVEAIRDSPDRHPESVAGWDALVGRLRAFDQLYIGA